MNTKSLLFLILFPFLSNGQSVLKAEFVMKVLPDHIWHLCLEDDQTFKVLHWSGWSLETTIDSGSYFIRGSILETQSKVADSLSKTYQITSCITLNPRKHQSPPFFLKKHVFVYRAYNLTPITRTMVY